MGYFILILTIIVYLIRPAEWVPALYFNWNMLLNSFGIVAIVSAYGVNNKNFNTDRTTRYLLGFILFMMLSNIANFQFGTIISYSIQMGSIVIIYILTQITIKKPEQINKFILLIVVLTLFICFQCYLQVKNGVNWGGQKPIYRTVKALADSGVSVVKEPQVRWFGVLSDPNDLGMLLIAFFPYMVNKIVFQKPSSIKRIFWLLAMLVIGNTVIMTNSRGSLLALMGGLSSFFILKKRSLVGVVIAVLVGIALMALGPSRMAELTSGDHSAMGRVYAWIDALKILSHNPLFGIGAKHYTDHHHLTTHNSFILALVENGIFGFIAYFSIFIISIDTAIRVAYSEENEKKSTEIISLVGGLIGIVISIFFISRTYVLLPFLYMAILTTYVRINCASIQEKEMVRLPLTKLAIYSGAFIVFMYIFNRLSTMFIA